MNNSVAYYMKHAIKYAKKGLNRQFLLGSIGVRSDGAIVHSHNGRTMKPSRHTHAEHRLARKLDVGSTVYVARVTRSGELANAKPCKTCMTALRRKGVKRVYFTVDQHVYDWIDF